MLIKPEFKKIVLKLDKPERVLAVIPHARTIQYKGQDLVVVPHRDEEVRILGNLGIEAPMPIEYYYRWSGQYKPFAHQLVTSSFLTRHLRAYCLNDMGSGKTLSVLWSYDYLRSIGKVKRMLVIAPLSTLEQTWGDAIFRNFPHLTFSVLHGTRERRRKLLDQPVDIYIINHDGLKVLANDIAKRDDISVVVPDELAVYRNKSTDRWKALRKLVPHPNRICWGLTGTPTPTAPTDAWAQCLLINPDNVPAYMGVFKSMTMRQLSQFKWIPKPEATAIVAAAMQPSIRFKREDCIDLPPVTYETRSVEMTKDQKDAYKGMLTKLYTEINGTEVTAVNEAVKMMKLVQIVCGAVYSGDGETAFVPATSRLALTDEIIQEAGSKVIVFVPFTGALLAVAEYLRHKGHTVEIINGAVSKTARDQIFREFQHEENPRVIVAQPSAMSHGLTLTAASVIVWFAPPNSLETYEQACARITRPGQKLNQLIVNVEGSPVERKIYERLLNRGKMQGLLLDAIEEGV